MGRWDIGLSAHTIYESIPMPSKTKKQANFMRMCASTEGRKAATTKCPPKKVAKEFAHADKGRFKKKKRKH